MSDDTVIPFIRPEAARNAISAVARSISGIAWFDAAGGPLADHETDAAVAWMSGLGLDEFEVIQVAGWADAAAIASDPGWNEDWWTREEDLRRELLQNAGRVLPESELITLLTTVTEAATVMVQGAAAVSAMRDGIADSALVKVAAGAATQACYQGALASATPGDASQAFLQKFHLYQSGRWPVNVIGQAVYLL